MRQSPAVQLFLCGAAALFWELILIRWLGSCVRVVAYYTNFILISAFFGLGAGALLVRYRARLWHAIVPAISLAVLMGPLLGSLQHTNPSQHSEFVWVGVPPGLLPPEWLGGVYRSYGLILLLAYLVNASVFLMFGQWLGHLFNQLAPLRAYAIEISGSLLGIALFALVSLFSLSPPLWFLMGFALVIIALEARRLILGLSVVLAGFALVTTLPFSDDFLWSRYYKIRYEPLTTIMDMQRQEAIRFDRPIGVSITVNNDYHQMILDLRPHPDEHPFLQSWRWTYEYPYRPEKTAPPGPILIVGAGSGNDVSAALRNTDATIDAVEIDPMIVELGRRFHPERPYADPRVRVIVNDARSFFLHTDRRYATVVFGFLDSHTLMSSFSSLRLDNFVYTKEAMERVKELLVPGGNVFVTFASNTDWIHQRMLQLLDSVFDEPTRFVREPQSGYSNGVIYINGTAPAAAPSPTPSPSRRTQARIPTDDWPFLYMKEAVLPPHYQFFMALIVLMGASALFLLPPGQRQIKAPYFFLGAGFFLIETSNVVSLSLLYGSTWIVNVVVFMGILALVLAGTLTCTRMPSPRPWHLFLPLFASVLIAWATPTSALLQVDSPVLRGMLAVLIFLGPVYVASLIFGHLIKRESNLAQAYGSNLLGAVVGGACEYLSLVMGLKWLLLLTLACYVLAFLSLYLPHPRVALGSR
jgi:hypothetical protein